MTGSEQYFDPDDVLHTERLEPITVDLKPKESPPPFVPDDTTSDSPAPESSDSDSDLAIETARPPKTRKVKRKRGRPKASLGDAVLLSYLNPNRPDIAQHAGQEALDVGSGSEGDDDEDSDREVEMGDADSEEGTSPDAGAELEKKALDALDKLEGEDIDDARYKTGALDDKIEDVNTQLLANGVGQDPTDWKQRNGVCPKNPPQLPSSHSSLDFKPPPKPLLPGLITRNHVERSRDSNEDDEPISPSLVKFAIPQSEADPESTLPAMQKSPPRSHSTHSPENSQTLPSLKTTLSQISQATDSASSSHGPSPYSLPSAQSPTMTRQSPYQMSGGPSPAAFTHPSPAMSPPGYPSQPSHPNYWRREPKEGSMSTPSTFEASTPSSAPGPSPASAYPTPTIQDHRGSIDESSTPQLLNGSIAPNGPFTTSNFKCSHSGCTAAPFQTQYLLNSHMNVHSSSRPHFCPVAECPRGPGGKGFKRKNEMIRHGLVHQSPGYIW